jgi:hypothetical protein
MDTTNMSANASRLTQQFPDITWHHATDIARQFQSDNRGAAAN